MLPLMTFREGKQESIEITSLQETMRTFQSKGRMHQYI